MKQPKILLIEWIDSSSRYDSWEDVETVREWAKTDPLVIQSVGFVVGETKETITLTLCMEPNHTCHHIKIPKVAIRWKRVLKP